MIFCSVAYEVEPTEIWMENMKCVWLPVLVFSMFVSSPLFRCCFFVPSYVYNFFLRWHFFSLVVILFMVLVSHIALTFSMKFHSARHIACALWILCALNLLKSVILKSSKKVKLNDFLCAESTLPPGGDWKKIEHSHSYFNLLTRSF